MCSPKKSKSSTSDDQEPEEPQPPDDSCRQDTSESSADRQLVVTTSIGVTSSPTGILDSVLGSGVKRDNRAAGDILGRTVAAAGTAYINELRPRGTAIGSTEFYERCTESLGFESMSETMDLCKAIKECSFKTKMYGVMRDKRTVKDIPPLLSSLDSSGRPRFSLEKVRSDGRLNIVKVDNADLVGDDGGDMAPRTVEMGRDKDQEDDVSGNDDEMKNDDQEMIGDDRQDDDDNEENNKEEDMAGDDHQEEMIGDLDGNYVNQTVEMTGDGQDDDGKKDKTKKKKKWVPRQFV